MTRSLFLNGERSHLAHQKRLSLAQAKVWGDTLAFRAMYPTSPNRTPMSLHINQSSNTIKMFFNKQSAVQYVPEEDFESDEELQYTETEIDEFDALCAMHPLCYSLDFATDEE